MDAPFPPAEVWIVEPPAPTPQFTAAVGYLLNAGVDFAFGPGDALPKDPPDSLDGIRAVLVCLEDLPRVQRRLRGFRGFHPDRDPPYDLSEGVRGPWSAKTLKDRQAFEAWFTQSYIHENGRTWLLVYGREALGSHNSVQSPLMIVGDLTLRSAAMSQRLLARPDRAIRDVWIESVLASPRRDWGDILFNHGKQLLDDYEVTGDRRCLDAARRVFSEMIQDLPPLFTAGKVFPSAILPRLYELTGEEKYLTPVGRIVDEALHDAAFRPASTGYCHAALTFSPATRAWFLEQGGGERGTYAEQMAGVYLPLILLARHSPRRREIEDLAAECAETLCRNLRDERTGLYWHGLPARRAGHEAFMGHGTGWSAFGLAQILDALGPEHPRRPALLRHFQQLCGAAAACQDANGGFHSLLNVPWTLFNVHYTGWLGYAFLHGARCGHLDVEFRERGRRAWHALKRRTFRGGIITSCGGSPVARCLDFYVERFGELRMDHFAAPSPRQALYTLNEILRLAS